MYILYVWMKNVLHCPSYREDSSRNPGERRRWHCDQRRRRNVGRLVHPTHTVTNQEHMDSQIKMWQSSETMYISMYKCTTLNKFKAYSGYWWVVPYTIPCRYQWREIVVDIPTMMISILTLPGQEKSDDGVVTVPSSLMKRGSSTLRKGHTNR